MVPHIVSVLAALVISSSAFAVQPNLFSCKSENGSLEVGYTSTSFAGIPTFSALRDGNRLTSGEGQKVTLHQEATTLGKLVSAVVSKRGSEGPARIYGVFIPNIELGEHSEATFSTYYIQGTVNPTRETPVVTHELEEPVKVDCEARHVYF